MFDQAEAIQFRHHDISQDKIRYLFLNRSKSGFTVADGTNLQYWGNEFRYVIAHVGIVVDHQNLRTVRRQPYAAGFFRWHERTNSYLGGWQVWQPVRCFLYVGFAIQRCAAQRPFRTNTIGGQMSGTERDRHGKSATGTHFAF